MAVHRTIKSLISRFSSGTGLIWAAVLTPGFFIALTIWHNGFDVPHMDQWELVPLLKADAERRITLAQLWAPHNEHRLVIPRLVMLFLARVSHWNIRCELLLNFFLALIIMMFVVLLIRDTVKRIAPDTPQLTPWLALISGLLIFSLTQWHNWVWGWQNQIFFNVLATVTTAWAIGRYGPRWPGLLLGLAGAVVAMLSFANGLLLFFLLSGALIVPQPNREKPSIRLLGTVIPFFLGIVFTVLYLKGLGLPPRPSLTPIKVLSYVQYTLAYLGSGLSQWNLSLAIGWGAMGLMILIGLAAFLLCTKTKDLKAITPFLLLSTYAILSGLLSAMGRTSFGVKQALAPRYVTISTLFWISVVVVTASVIVPPLKNSGDLKPLPKIILTTVTILALLAFTSTGISWISSWTNLLRYAKIHQAGLVCVQHYEEASDRCLQIHYPDPKVLRQRAQWLKENHLSLFRNPGNQ
jgi:hypothetical protein